MDDKTKVFAARLKDEKRLKNSSSGGVFSAFSDKFLESGNAIVSAIYDYKSKQAEFMLYTDGISRDKAIGSKYMQSIPGDIFNESLSWLQKNPGKELLFIGMGCQSAGFIKYATVCGLRERVIVVDIICHGSPSPMIWKEYAEGLERRKGRIEYITFKDKRNGWKSPTAFVVIDKREVSISDYVRLFYSRCILRPSCHKCPYASVERNTDITIGDFWGIDEVMPDFYDENGNSLVLVHSEKGFELFNKVKCSLDIRESNRIDCLQPNLIKPTVASELREGFWNDYRKHGFEYIMKKYCSVSLNTKLKNKIKKDFRNILSCVWGGENSH